MLPSIGVRRLIYGGASRAGVVWGYLSFGEREGDRGPARPWFGGAGEGVWRWLVRCRRHPGSCNGTLRSALGWPEIGF